MKPKIPKPPLCPFCGQLIERPRLLPIGLSEYEAGECSCGAVYVCDPTGFSRGAVFLEAIVLACKGDWNLALDLIPDEDYREIWLENYDPETHTIPGEPIFEGRKIRSALCFIKLAEDLQELSGNRHHKPQTLTQSKETTTPSKRLTRNEAEELLKKDQLQELIELVVSNPSNLQVLQKLLYHPDEALRKKAIYCLGQVGKNLANTKPHKISELLKKLIYASTDSASSPWGALEAVGELIAETGERFSIYVKNLFAFLKYPEYIPYVLPALERIAMKNPSAFKKGPFLRLLDLFPRLSSQEQAMVIRIFTWIRGKELLSLKNTLRPERVRIYDNESFQFKEHYINELWSEYERSCYE